MIRALFILLIVIVVPVFFVLMWVVGAYNRLVALRNRFKNAYAQIDVQLKRRYDLIPNLVETAKGYIKHERGTLEAVVAARNAASAANVRAAQNPGDAAAMKESVRRGNRPDEHAWPPLRRRRSVSGPQGQHDDDGPDGRADLDREQSRFCPAGLQ